MTVYSYITTTQKFGNDHDLELNIFSSFSTNSIAYFIQFLLICLFSNFSIFKTRNEFCIVNSVQDFHFSEIYPYM